MQAIIEQAISFLPTDYLNTYFNNDNSNFAMFLAQGSYESSTFTIFQENFNYSVEGLLATFGDKFTQDQANQYGRTTTQAANQQMIANIAYANRYGNGDIDSGDGYRYSGKGIFQLTFKYNYQVCGNELDIDLVGEPQLLLNMNNAFLSALWFWNKHDCNNACPDVVQVTKIINGGNSGLDERTALYNNYLKLLCS